MKSQRDKKRRKLRRRRRRSKKMNTRFTSINECQNKNINQSFLWLGQLAYQHLEDQEEQGLNEIVIRAIRQERKDQLSFADLDGLAKKRVG